MTESHLRKCNPHSLIRQIVLGLVAGILCFLVLSYSDSSARKDEPEVGEAAPAPADASQPAAGPDEISGAVATLIPPAETGLPLPSAPESIEGQAEGAAGELTPMLDVPVSGALPIAAEEVVAPEPPMPAAPAAPLVVAEPAAVPEPVSTPAPEPVSKPAAKSVSKPAPAPAPQGKASGKVSLTPASVLQQKNINHLSIQLMGASSLDAVAQFVRANRLADQVWIYQTNFHGSPWYVVLKGDYADLSQAQAAIRQLSPALQKADPWPKSFAQVNRELMP
ncbi:SPOR domain-containing protein [Aeromonas eucrenophila]|uniref:SPOR domain-containing protein n=1 Tax=Aeromonas eucrenophila TaxID=649 RepID=A0ABW0Y5S8_9GAMM|nr:SPOR domain-containing protein [Aeromonas eucrenophila]